MNVTKVFDLVTFSACCKYMQEAIEDIRCGEYSAGLIDCVNDLSRNISDAMDYMIQHDGEEIMAKITQAEITSTKK